MVEPAALAVGGGSAGTDASQPFFAKLLKQADDAEDDDIEATIKVKLQTSTKLAEKMVSLAGAGTGDAAAQEVFVKALEAGSTKDDYEKQLVLVETERDTLAEEIKLAKLDEEKSRDQGSRAKARAEEADKRCAVVEEELKRINAAAEAERKAKGKAGGAAGAGGAGAGGASSAEVAKLKSELKGATEKAAGRLQELEKYEAEIAKLTEAELKARLGAGKAAAPNANASSQELQQQLKHAADVLENERRRYDADREKMRSENAAKHGAMELAQSEVSKFAALAAERKTVMDKTVNVFKTDFSRFKSERDKAQLQLQSALAAGSPDQRKAAKEAADTIASLQEESARHQAEATKLKARLNARLEQDPAVAGDEGIKALNKKLLHGELNASEMERHLRILVAEIGELRAASAEYVEMETVLGEELEATGDSLEQERKSNTALRRQLNEKEEALYETLDAKGRSEQAMNSVLAKGKLNADLIKSLKEEVSKKQQLVSTQRENERLLKDAKFAAEKRAREMELKALEERKVHEKQARTFNSVVKEKDHAVQNAEKFAAEVAAKGKSARKAERELNRLKEEHKIAKRELVDLQSTSGGSASTEGFKEQIKDLRKKIRCPACNVNERNAVLTRCGHMFCLECIETRYKNRDRKCPSCSKAIGNKEWLKVYFA